MAFGDFKNKERIPKNKIFSRIESNMERFKSAQNKSELINIQRQIDRMSNGKAFNGALKQSEDDDDFDVNEYLDSILKRVSFSTGDLKSQPRRVSFDTSSTDFVSRHEHVPTSHMERWKSAHASPSASPQTKRKFSVTANIKQRVMEEEREKTNKIKELEQTLRNCVRCLKQGFCHVLRHKKIYLEILAWDVERIPSDESCTCCVCQDGGYQCACVFKELIRLVKKNAIDCCCTMCEMPRQHCLREQIRLMRKGGLNDVLPYTTSSRRDGSPQFAIDVFSSLKGSNPLEWIAMFICTGM